MLHAEYQMVAKPSVSRSARGTAWYLAVVLMAGCLLSAAVIRCHGEESVSEAEIESAIAGVRALDDEPIVLDDETREHWNMLMGGYIWLMPPSPTTVSAAARYWYQFLGSQLVEVPEIADLIGLGSAAAPKVNQALQGSSPSDEAVDLLALVIGRIGNHESVPVLIDLLQRAETADRECERQLLALVDGNESQSGEPVPYKEVNPDIYEATVWALQELTGRRHAYDAERWQVWWSMHKDSFVPLHQRGSLQVSSEQVEELLYRSSSQQSFTLDDRLLQGEALAALGEGAIPHLLDPPVSWRRAQMAIRFALDELGSAHLLEPAELQEYLVWRFHTDDSRQPIGRAARSRAFTELPFDLFCRVALESDRYYYGNHSMASWINIGSPKLVQSFGDRLEARVHAAVPVIEDGLSDPDAAVRSVAIELADKIGRETDLALPGLVSALLDRTLDEELSDLRRDVWVALSRFATEQVRDAVSSALLSDDTDLIRGAMTALHISGNLLEGAALETAASRLEDLLYHDDCNIRESAASALRGSHDELLVSHCQQVLTDCDSYWLREQCAIALASIAPQRQYGELLLRLAADPSRSVYSWAIRALADRELCLLAPRLIELSRQHSDTTWARSGILEALAEMGGPAAFAELIAALDRAVTERKQANTSGLPQEYLDIFDPQADEKNIMELLEAMTGRSFATADEWLTWSQTSSSEVTDAVGHCD
jgi:HEAT repeat protein